MSWVDDYVKMLFNLRDSEFYIVASGLTTSGPAHMGTVMEVLIPYTISKAIKARGRKSYFIFIADTMDSLDSIPVQLTSFTELKEFIGRPLYRVLDPYGCHESYGYHFLDEVLNLMRKLSIECDEVLTADRLYMEGWYDDYAKLFFSRLDEVRNILETTSFRKLPPNWMGVVKPICGRCGRNDSTVVLSFSNDLITYECASCGFKSSMLLEDHNWKLLWRLDWPSRQDFLGVDVEGGGVDHFTRGGSWDTATEVHRRLFCKEPPVGFKFGFVLIDGKKMSKSKGLGSLSDIMRFIHPAVIKYFLLKHDLEENRNLRMDPKYLISLYEEYKLVGDGKYQDVKQLRAWELSGGVKWKTSFGELLIYYQIYGDWNVISDLTKDYESVNELKSYVEEWVNNKLLPDEYDVQLRPSPPPRSTEGLILEFCNLIDESMSDVDIHNKVYEVARSRGEDPSELFKAIYLLLFSKPKGPRLGKFIKVLGVKRFKAIVNEVLTTSPS
ncbi:MAG: lysine--tRNA ligase [Sulfolobales archaeon]